MGISFGEPPSVPQYFTSTAFHIDLVLGFLVAVASAVVSNKFGDFMFSRGYVKPFYVLRRRIHHSWIATLIPVCYLALSYFVVGGSVQLVRSLLWYRLALILPVIVFCMTVDFLGDRRRPRSSGILRYEWIYAMIPIYIFAFVFNVYL